MMLFDAVGVAAGGSAAHPVRAAALAVDDEAAVPRSEAVVDSEVARAAAVDEEAAVPRSQAVVDSEAAKAAAVDEEAAVSLNPKFSKPVSPI